MVFTLSYVHSLDNCPCICCLSFINVRYGYLSNIKFGNRSIIHTDIETKYTQSNIVYANFVSKFYVKETKTTWITYYTPKVL